jgi:AcrR family transcriptional regulator
MAVPARALESTRDKLLDAATAVFSERGYDGAGVQEIARRAGLTTGAIYANFSGKAELLLEAIGARSADDLDDLLRPARESLSAGDLLAELGSHLLDPPHGEGEGLHAGLLIEAFVAARRDADLSGLVKGLIDERARGIGTIVDAAKRDGSIGPDVSADAVGRFALVLALGSLLYTSIGIDRPDADEWSSLIRRIVRSFQEEPTT